MRSARGWLSGAAILLTTTLLTTQLAHAQVAPPATTAPIPDAQYLSPVPGSSLNLPETNIIIRPGGIVDPSSVGAGLLTVAGSLSGAHDGRTRISDDEQTVTFRPYAPFAFGEVVTCRLNAGLRTSSRGEIAAGEFTFSIEEPARVALRTLGPSSLMEDLVGQEAAIGPEAAIGQEAAIAQEAASASAVAVADTVPPDFPHIRSTTSGVPAPGLLFLSDFRLGPGPPRRSYLMIVRDDGTPVFSRGLRRIALDFKPQPDGRLTYYDTAVGYYYVMNPLYSVVDSVRCGNGYQTDGHDLQLLPNGHALLMGADLQAVDMSWIVSAGSPNAMVTGLIVQELDREGEVVFQWRSWDHFQITDATQIDLTREAIDYVHGNAIVLDTDGNIMISSRHMDEITKIDRITGDIIWRLGGKNNQFTFVNDALGFSYQHAIRRIANGNITLFDNGNFHRPCFSRAVEYALDEGRKTATLVWQYRHVPDVCGFALGYVQRFPGGHTLIGWGAASPTLTEVAADGTVITELTFDPGIASYRAFRYEWPPVKPAIACFTPPTISATDPGLWVDVMVEPESFDPATIDRATVRLAGTIPAELAGPADVVGQQPCGSTVGSTGDLSHQDIGVSFRFSLRALAPLLTPGLNRLEISGSLTTGERFRGFGEITLLLLRVQRQQGQQGLTTISAPGAIPAQFSLRGAGAAEPVLAIYDVRGHLVNRWRARTGNGGVVSWDGRTSSGSRVGSGIYFVRVESPKAGPAAKLVIFK